MPEMDPVTRVLAALSAKGSNIKKQGKEWKAQCPSHQDNQASLQVGYGDKGAVLNCQAGCKTTDVVAALDMKMSELFDDVTLNMVRNVVRGDGNVIDRYQYTDETGNLLFEVEKRMGKKFLQRVPDDKEESGWRYSLGTTRRVLYRLRGVVHARTEQLPIYIVEGEKDVHTLEGLGLVATCNPGGAGKWRQEFNDFFHGAHVIIIPDNDKPGELHADLVVSNIKGVARSVRIINLPVKEKGDVTDWVMDGGTKEDLERLVVAAEVVAGNGPLTFTASDLSMQEFPPMRWAVEPLIAEGLTLLVGRPKIGKSWFSLNLALSVAAGTPALNTLQIEQGPVLYLALEDTPRRLQSRMNLILGPGGKSPDDLHFATQWPKVNVGGLEQIEVWMEDNPDARMVVIDTYAKIKAQTNEESMYQADYAQISQFKALADRHGVPIILVHHQRKAADEDPLNTISGSTGLTGAADAAVILTRQRGADDGYLYVTGRDVEENRYLLGFDSSIGTWTYMGEAEEMEEANNENSLIKLLADSTEPMGPKEIATTLGIPEGTAKWLTSKLAQEDKITRVGRGKYVIGTGVQPPAGTMVIPGQVTLEDAFGDLEDDFQDDDDEGEDD